MLRESKWIPLPWIWWRERSPPVAEAASPARGLSQSHQIRVRRRNRRHTPRLTSRQKRNLESDPADKFALGAAMRRGRFSVKESYGFTITLPNIWLFSKYSWAARISLSGKTRSTTG